MSEHDSPREGAITPHMIRRVRKSSGLTIKKAAALVHVHPRTWQKWEYGERHMPRGLWEYFLLIRD